MFTGSIVDKQAGGCKVCLQGCFGEWCCFFLKKILPFLFHIPPFQKPGAYITHNAPEPLCDITGGDLPDCMELHLEPNMH